MNLIEINFIIKFIRNIQKSEYYSFIQEKLNYKSIKEENNKYIICCCNNEIEHDEILKIKYEHINGELDNISPFIFNKKGTLSNNSNIKIYFDKDKYVYTLGRKKLMGEIFNNIKNKEKYTFLLGDKDLEKIDFAESLCVYLFERKIIDDYEIFRINSDFDFNYMNDKINEINKKYEYSGNKKINIIKFDIEENKNEKIIKYLNIIYNN